MKTTPIRCVVGLGNPGAKYADNRHNVGFWLVDRLAQQFNAMLRKEDKFSGEVARISHSAGECWLLKPDTFMNHSGRAVSALARFYKLPIDTMLIVHDELDLPPGVIRLKTGGGHGGHNGLRDIVSAMEGQAFHRIRIGIGHPGHKSLVSNYVLSAPTKTDYDAMLTGLDAVEQHWMTIQSGDIPKAMQLIHRKI
jgi:PTH1 family peptidyl-tRNA hydrolase